MTLADAGPLVALVDADEPDHERCREALDRLTLPLITTWPAFTEAMYLVGRAGAWTAQEALWRLVRRGELVLASPSATAVERASELMETYSDRPMDLADATLIALAEEQDLKRVFTLDADFSIYRLKDKRHLEIVPAPPRRRL